MQALHKFAFEMYKTGFVAKARSVAKVLKLVSKV
jgi:hypothetical protein